MRDIRFRAKRKDNGEWTYGYVDATMYKDIVVIHTDNSTHEVDPETVGQYTGVEDSSGNPVYEGDIIAMDGNPWGIVMYNDDGYFYLNDLFDDAQRDKIPFGTFLKTTCRKHQFCVSGNIHDNTDIVEEFRARYENKCGLADKTED